LDKKYDICALVGIDDIYIGDTIADSYNPEPLPIIAIVELIDIR
jgi:GTP-binding protein